MSVYKIKASRTQQNISDGFVVEAGMIYYDDDGRTLRFGDGVTPGGLPLNISGTSNGSALAIQEGGITESNAISVLNFLNATVDVSNGVANIYAGAGSTLDGNISAEQIIELINNRHNGTYVGNVIFTPNVTAIGAGESVTLTIVAIENANRYDVDWGDGNIETNITSNTPSHVYSNIELQPFSVNVRAYNTAGIGYGSSAYLLQSNLIAAFAANPQSVFEMYANSTGGNTLVGSTLYAIENVAIYLDNNSTNTLGANVEYSVNWGDNNSAIISSDNDPGGADPVAQRLSHVYGTGSSTGTGSLAVTQAITAHSAANPSLLPITSTKTLKVYSAAPTIPAGLAGKTMSFAASVGTSPKLASGFTDNTGGASALVAGSTVPRTVATSGVVSTTTTTTYAYNANSGVLTSTLNGNVSGTISFTDAPNAGTNGALVVDSEQDYNLLDSTGTAVAFAQSIYYPGLYSGFTTRIEQPAANVPFGLNRMYVEHSDTGRAAAVDFVKDDWTSAPSISGGTISELTPGTYRYISGIPYYNAGNPSLRLSGVSIGDLTGQTYADIANVVEVRQNVLLENTSGAVINTQSYTYADINDTLNTMLDNGIPLVNVGLTSSYPIANLTIPVNSAGVTAAANLSYQARNVNGASTTLNNGITIQVYGALPSGINEQGIAVSAAIGNGVYTDAGLRTFALSSETTTTPSFSSSINYYTTNIYTSTSDPGVRGTKEATVRWGVLQHNVTDYSTGFLPAGPNRSGDTGPQFFTFAFRRQTVGNFSVAISAPAGVFGVWIAAPGTSIDRTSTLNGWLDCGAAYAGSGVPGANTGAGGNGSNGCASTAGSRILSGVALSGSYAMTLGGENLTNATNNVCLVRIALNAGQTVTALSIG